MFWNLMLVFNVFCIFASWRWSTEAFAEGKNLSGWFNLFASALNAAAVAFFILP